MRQSKPERQVSVPAHTRGYPKVARPTPARNSEDNAQRPQNWQDFAYGDGHQEPLPAGLQGGRKFIGHGT